MTRALVVLGTLLIASASTEAGAPPPEKSDLFEARVGGYARYRVPGLVVTAKGTLLAYCEARELGGADWGPIDILMRRSTDGGKTWGPPRKAATPPPDARKNPVAPASATGITLNNPVAIADPTTGVVHFLYCIEYARCFYRRSVDDGATFSDPVEITSTFDHFRAEYAWKVLATGPGHGIRLSNGRLLVPVWLSTSTGKDPHRPSVVSTIGSDDGGRTWGRGEIVVADPVPINPSESTAVELADGRVMLNIRNESEPHLRAVAVGPDGATGWSKPRFDPALPDPVCFGSLVRLSKRPEADKDRLLFVNPNNPSGRERRNLTVRLSEDEGRTWPTSKVIGPGLAGYADLAVGPDGAIYCFYERGTLGGGIAQPHWLTLARFNREWLAEPGVP